MGYPTAVVHDSRDCAETSERSGSGNSRPEIVDDRETQTRDVKPLQELLQRQRVAFAEARLRAHRRLRTAELAELRRLLTGRQANLVIVEGRRRIGKSRLVEEFGRGHRLLQLVGLAPTPGTDAQTQRDEFTRLLSLQTGLPKLTSDDWATLFQCPSGCNRQPVLFSNHRFW